MAISPFTENNAQPGIQQRRGTEEIISVKMVAMRKFSQ
jgi:hypothetical protein